MFQRFARVALGLSLPLVALATGACSSGGSSGSSEANRGSADLLVMSTGSAELYSLAGELESARLVAQDGTLGANLLAEPQSVEFLGEGGETTWLLRAAVPNGTYVALELDFDAASFDAVDRTGARDRVTVSDRPRRFEIDRRLVVDDRGTDRLVMQLDLESSLSQAPGGGFALDPEVEIVLNDPAPLEMVVGRYHGQDQGSGNLLLAHLRDGNSADPEPWRFEVELTPQTLLEDVNGALFPTQDAFLQSLIVGASILEVHGVLQTDGLVVASRVRIRAYAGAPGDPVRIAGMVLTTDPMAGEFELLIHRVAEGGGEAAPVLAALGDPESIRVAHDGGTDFVLLTGDPFTADDLRAGQEVEVTFASFVAEPFPAARVELDTAGVCFAARITDASELPDAITVVADHDCPSVQNGDIRSAQTEVRVELEDAVLTLVMRRKPAIGPEQLGVGMRVKLCGVLSDDPDAPVLTAETLDVHPGHLIKGEPMAFDPMLGTLVLGSGQIVRPFGGLVTGFPAGVVLDSGARFLQDAASASELFGALQGLTTAQRADLKIKGLQSGQPEEIRAYEVKLKVRRR